MKAKDFLSRDQQQAVVTAIMDAEKNTSGEIRVHIDERCRKSPVVRAQEVFHALKMDNTKLRNGVLVYVACKSKVFAIIGDKGINDVVPEDFWNDISSGMAAKFKEGQFAEGIIYAVKATGEKLKEFFPYAEDDVNEQPDDISFETESK
ncbi:MAG: TPM domain-containing protein [Candidatus Cryptobacteroides sp.]